MKTANSVTICVAAFLLLTVSTSFDQSTVEPMRQLGYPLIVLAVGYTLEK